MCNSWNRIRWPYIEYFRDYFPMWCKCWYVCDGNLQKKVHPKISSVDRDKAEINNGWDNNFWFYSQLHAILNFIDKHLQLLFAISDKLIESRLRTYSLPHFFLSHMPLNLLFLIIPEFDYFVTGVDEMKPIL